MICTKLRNITFALSIILFSRSKAQSALFCPSQNEACSLESGLLNQSVETRRDESVDSRGNSSLFIESWSTFSQPYNISQQAPTLKCNMQLQERISSETSFGVAVVGDMWDIQISINALFPQYRYKAFLFDNFTTEKNIWIKELSVNECEIYEEDSITYMSYNLELEYFRACRHHCHLPRPNVGSPAMSVSLLQPDGSQHEFEHVLCQDVGISEEREAEPYAMSIVYPSNKALLQPGPFNLHYILSRQERISPCELRALTLSIGALPYARLELARGVCDRQTTFRVDPPPPAGVHSLTLAALDAAGATLAAAHVSVTHLGHSLHDDPDALCLLSYSQSGNHLLRFVVEFLTARPTVGCRGNLADVPIHTNGFPAPHRPLDHVDPWAPPAAYKFHYSGPASAAKPGCSMPGRGCQRLVLLVRDFGACIPRFFEGSAAAKAQTAAAAGQEQVPTPGEQLTSEAIDEQAELYLDNVRTFAAFAGPRLLVRYEDLTSNSSTAAAVAAFLARGAGGAGAAGLARREAELIANYDALLALSRAASGRSWMGVRRAPSSYLRGWSNVHICHLARRFGAAVRPDRAGGGGGGPAAAAQAALAGYEGTLGLLETACNFV